MLIKDSKGRKVELEVGGKYSDNIQVESATYVDDGLDVPDSEIDYIYKTYEEEMFQGWHERKAAAAEARYDELRGH